MEAEVISVQIQVQNREARRVLEETVAATEGFKLYREGQAVATDVLIMEIGPEPDRDFDFIHTLLEAGTVGAVFLTSAETDPALLMRAIRAGAREFFPQPIDPQEVRQSLLRFKAQRQKLMNHGQRRKGVILHVMGAKGGVGTTTLAVNLATILARGAEPNAVALMDMNFLFGEAAVFLDAETTFHWGKITKNISRLDATLLMSVLTQHPSGVALLPPPAQLDGYSGVTRDVLRRLLTLMRTMFDYIVVDGGQLVNDVNMQILEMADEILVVAILSLPCLANVRRLLKLFHDTGIEESRVKVVVNRFLKNADISLEDAEKSIGKRVFATVPNDFRTTTTAINRGKPLIELAPKKPVTEAVVNLAASLAQVEPPKRRGFFGFRF
ncbi:MAG: AAA family ATPase [Desulfosoma sp.]